MIRKLLYNFKKKKNTEEIYSLLLEDETGEELEDYRIVSLSFEDENGIFYVKEDVLKEYNKAFDEYISDKALEEYRAEGDLFSYDTFNGEYPEEDITASYFEPLSQDFYEEREPF